MTSVLQIITDAYRESNIVAIGATLTDGQKAEGLRRLQAVVSSALGYEIGENLSDWLIGLSNVGDSYNPYDISAGWSSVQWTRPPTNVRLLLNAQSPQTIFLPSRADDGARFSAIDILGTLATYPVVINANGLRIESQPTITLNTNGLNKGWLYRADLASWVAVTGMTIAGDIPYPEEFDDAFVTWLAMRLNPRYGRMMDQQSGATMERGLNQLRARYKQHRIIPADPGAVRLTRGTFRGGYGSYGSALAGIDGTNGGGWWN